MKISFSKSIIASVAAHGALFFGASVLVVQNSQYGVDSGDGGAGGAVEVTLGAPSDSTPEPEPTTESEPVENESLISDFPMEEMKVKTTEIKRPEPHQVSEAFKPSVSKMPSANASSAGNSSSTQATGSGGARMADRADYLRNPPPAYPPEAKKKGQQGTVLLLVEISESGCVESISVRGSSGYMALDDAALKAVKRWRFQPAKIAGVGIKSSVKVPIRFDLQ